MLGQLKQLVTLNDERGFSLIELLVVIVILGILAAVSVPNMRTWQVHSRVNRDARIIMGVLQQARLEAVKRNEFVSITFSNNTGTTPHFTVFFDDNMNRVLDAGEEVFTTGNFLFADHVATFSSAPTTTVIFNTRGMASPNRVSSTFISGDITLTNTVDNYSKQISVGVSGQIRIL